MVRKSLKICKKIKGLGDTLCVRAHVFMEQNPQQVLFALGVIALTLGVTELTHAQPSIVDELLGGGDDDFDDREIRKAVCQLFRLIEGAYGALLMTVAGIGAIVAAAVGGYKAAYQCLVVGIGAFILRSMVSLWFGTNFNNCGGDSIIPDVIVVR